MNTPGITDIVKRSLFSVFDELNLSTEAWFQKTKIMTTGRRRYAEFIASDVGRFPLFGTTFSASVEDSYVNMNLSTEIDREIYKSIEKIERSLRREKSGGVGTGRSSKTRFSPSEALEATETNLALLGSAGSGKTTAFRHLAVSIARGQIVRGKHRIPIYLAVRDMASEERGIAEAAIEVLEMLDVKVADRLFEALMASGRVVLFVDGLDETTEEHQSQVLREFSKLSSRYRQAILCVSARPYSLSVGLASVTKWETLPLAPEDRLKFVEKWFENVDRAKGRRLMDECRDRPELLDLGSNPLLLSIVCALFNNDLQIPSDSDELYERVIQGLLGSWDSFRNIARTTVLASLSVRKRSILVSFLAAALFEKRKIVFSYRDVELTGSIKSAAARMRAEIPSTGKLLHALYSDFGILSERSPGIFSFSHLTIQEYLVARYVVDSREEIRMVVTRRRQKEWFEVIHLVARMLPDAGEFLKILFQNSRVDDPYDVRLLKASWEAEPVCAPEVLKAIMTDLATGMKRILNQYSNSVEFRGGGSGLFVVRKGTSDFWLELWEDYESSYWERFNEHPVLRLQRDGENISPEELSDVEGQVRAKYEEEIDGDELVKLMRCLPGLFSILSSCGLSYKQLKCDHVPLFRALAARGQTAVDRVYFTGEGGRMADGRRLSLHIV